jgi:flagellar biosynthesis protein FliR
MAKEKKKKKKKKHVEGGSEWNAWNFDFVCVFARKLARNLHHPLAKMHRLAVVVALCLGIACAAAVAPPKWPTTVPALPTPAHCATFFLC